MILHFKINLRNVWKFHNSKNVCNHSMRFLIIDNISNDRQTDSKNAMQTKSSAKTQDLFQENKK